MKQGKVFSIEEFSVFDGDGIRTTVFLKGCPMRCVWCHSPESQTYESEYLRSPNGCLHCDRCLDAGEKETGKRVLSRASVAACPRNLVRLCGETFDAETLCERLLREKDVLDASGGGVTFSGGEPTMQAEFLLECLRLLKGKLNRGLQTCGKCPPAVFEKIAEECDLILFDLKIFDKAAHLKYVGADNEDILINFDIALRSGAKVVPRMPLIPTLTDTESNVNDWCEWLNERGVKYVELLKYNKMAGSKYKLAGRVWNPPFDESIDCVVRKEIYEKHGIEYKIV